MRRDEQSRGFVNHVLLGEIAFQSQLAARAAEHLQACTENHGRIGTWGAIQSILIAAANVSKILWPSRREYVARGEALRALLAIEGGNALSDRKFRNHFEHYDERIEDWFSSVHSAHYTDQIIGSPPGFLREFPQNAHRGYDPSTRTLTFRGEGMNLGAIISAFDEILQKCSQFTLV